MTNHLEPLGYWNSVLVAPRTDFDGHEYAQESLWAATDMPDELPGFILQVLSLGDVSLLRADETVFNAMVDGWRA